MPSDSIDPFHFSIGIEANRLPVGRPKRAERTFGARQGLRRDAIQGAQPKLNPAFVVSCSQYDVLFVRGNGHGSPYARDIHVLGDKQDRTDQRARDRRLVEVDKR